jgi:hypothetical protein
LSRIAHVLTYRSKDAVCVSAGYTYYYTLIPHTVFHIKESVS